MEVSHAIEVSFRLGPGTLDDARQIAGDLSVAALRCQEDMFFVDDSSGTFGYLALWNTAADAEKFAEAPEVLDVVESLSRRLVKPPAVRQYTVERPKEYR